MVAVISERQWRIRLSADPSIVGRTLVAEGHPLTIVGVVADTFTSPNLGWGQRPDVWVPIGAERLGRTIEPIRSAGIFFGGLAAVAVVVALIGLHATLGHSVQSRTREIVLRQALGATRVGSAVVVLRTPLVVAVVAVIAGACAAWMLAPLLAAQTRGLESNPVLVSLFTAAAVALACLATASISGARAARLPLARTLAGGEDG